MRVLGISVAACLAACGSPLEQSAFFSFEGSLQGWEPQGLNLDTGSNQQEAWFIVSDRTAPFDGGSSARFSLENTNGAGKIWLERPFALTSSGRHHVHIDFTALGQTDPVAPDRLLVGVFPAPPRNADALQAALQPPGIAGTAWTPHGYELETQGPTVTVVIGIAGASTGRTVYHLDALTVRFTDTP